MQLVNKTPLVVALGLLTAIAVGGTAWVVWKEAREAKARHHNNLGVALMDPDWANDKPYNKAVEEFEAALRYWPSYRLARVNLGIAQFREGQADQAISTLEDVLREDPKNLQAHYTIGLVQAER